MTRGIVALKEFVKIGSIFILSMLLLLLLHPSIVFAADPGYFTDSTSPGEGDYVMKRIYDYAGGTKMAIPQSVDTKSEFVKFLQDKNANTGQDRTGSAYIVCTMLDQSFDECRNNGYISPAVDGRTIQPSGWEELNRRLEPIVMVNLAKATYKKYTNTLYGTSSGDIHTYIEKKKDRTAIDFRLNGVTKYRFMRECANPVGDFPGLPPQPKNWSLTTYVSLNPSDYVEAGSSFNITSSVNNTGEVTSGNVTYKLEKKVGGGTYSTYSTYSGPITFRKGATYVTNNLPFSDTDYDAGTQICFRLSVTPRSNTNPPATSSAEDCVVIGKKPKVQVWGGDLWVRGNIRTSASIKSSAMYGSWGEYALFAGGSITGMASGSAIAAGLTSYSNVCNYSKLTFANTLLPNSCSNNTTDKGYYDTASRIIPDVASSFPISAAVGNINGTISLGGLASGAYRSTGSRDITINESAIPPNKWIVLNVPDKNVTIAGDITYTPATLHNLEEIPQVVIIAKNITINATVTNVDAWLIAPGGSIKTCEVAAKTVGECNDKLTINGPVMTDKLYLYRTAGSGSGSDSGEPAEIINLRADAYLWAYARTLGQGRIRTVHTRELPPRF